MARGPDGGRGLTPGGHTGLHIRHCTTRGGGYTSCIRNAVPESRRRASATMHPHGASIRVVPTRATLHTAGCSPYVCAEGEGCTIPGCSRFRVESLFLSPSPSSRLVPSRCFSPSYPTISEDPLAERIHDPTMVQANLHGIRDVGSGNPLRPRAATSSSPSFASLLESIPPVLSPPQIRIPGGSPYSYGLLSRIEMCQSIPEMYNNRKGNNPFASSDCECNLC